MEYKPALPEHNDNVSHEHPAREFIILACGITLFLLAVFWLLGLCVDLAVERISPEMEAVIFASDGSPGPDPVDGSEPRQAKLQNMVDALRECGGITCPLKVALIDSDDANALAFPGGRIFVLNGLLDTVASENGLAFVLAHELAHFKNRDHLRGLGRGIVLTAVAALLTGAGSEATQLLAPSANFTQAQYSQDREELADEQALRTLACYYGHAGGATEFFEAMKERDQDILPGFGHYFSTHPEALERIDNLRRLTQEQDLAVEAVLPLPAVLKARDLVETN
jgi:Zn-dependent protease with chaperone function